MLIMDDIRNFAYHGRTRKVIPHHTKTYGKTYGEEFERPNNEKCCKIEIWKNWLDEFNLHRIVRQVIEKFKCAKKQGAKACGDYRAISLMSQILNRFLKIMHQIIYKLCEEKVADTKFGYELWCFQKAFYKI